MKLNNGFVSNSSSCSFIVNSKVYRSVFDLAQWMVRYREWDTDNDLILAIERGKKKVDPNTSIAFRTCNYDTYIRQFGDRIYIQTSHNHDFNLKGVVEIPQENFTVSDRGTFWYPEYDLMGHRYIPRDKAGEWDWTKDSFCRIHSVDLIQLMDWRIICPECYKTATKELSCNCNHWRDNSEFLLEIINYRGKTFEFCPWCGNKFAAH